MGRAALHTSLAAPGKVQGGKVAFQGGLEGAVADVGKIKGPWCWQERGRGAEDI